MSAAPTLLLDAPREVAAFVAARVPGLERICARGGYQAVGVTRRGRLIGGFVFYDMADNRADVQMAAAGTGAFLSEDVIRFLHHNAFNVLGVAHVTCRNSAENTRAIKADLRAGFRIEGRQRKAWDGVQDAVLLGLIREDTGTPGERHSSSREGHSWGTQAQAPQGPSKRVSAASERTRAGLEMPRGGTGGAHLASPRHGKGTIGGH